MRRLLVPLFALMLATPLAAYFDRGWVFMQTTGDLWVAAEGSPWATLTGWTLISKTIPFNFHGHFLMPSPDLILFHTDGTVAFWDGVVRTFNEPGLGYTPIFHDDNPLSEFAIVRGGRFLLAERPNEHGAKLIEFDTSGIVDEFAFAGADHIEVMSDHCTVLYTIQSENAVHRFNICTRQPETDFATLMGGQIAGAIRQLPNGDVLVANGYVILEFTSGGSFVRNFDFPGVSHIALSVDGKSFWAAGSKSATLRHFNLNGVMQSLELGNPGMMPRESPRNVSDLVTVGEWRASLAAKRRLAHH